jgi:hypothetical protein
MKLNNITITFIVIIIAVIYCDMKGLTAFSTFMKTFVFWFLLICILLLDISLHLKYFKNEKTNVSD